MVLKKSQINVDELNEIYYRVAELIGLDDMIQLSEILAGKAIKFKKSYDLNKDYQEIVKCIGKAKTDRLIRGFYGEHVYFSSMKKALKTQIHGEIHKEFNGYNYKQLAKKYGYTERAIRKIISKKT